jgi:hypothetical protein
MVCAKGSACSRLPRSGNILSTFAGTTSVNTTSFFEKNGFSLRVAMPLKLVVVGGSKEVLLDEVYQSIQQAFLFCFLFASCHSEWCYLGCDRNRQAEDISTVSFGTVMPIFSVCVYFFISHLLSYLTWLLYVFLRSVSSDHAQVCQRIIAARARKHARAHTRTHN